MKRSSFRGKKIGVIGLGRSGIAAANLAKKLGAEVLVSETRSKKECRSVARLLHPGIVTEFSGHSAQLLSRDIIIKSPGVPQDLPILTSLRKKKIPIWSEIEFALRCINCRSLIAITGTNGKTTTTALTGEIFKAAGRKTIVAGNIGAPLASKADRSDASTAVVLEVSSYQLEDSPSFHPSISAILNITPDHMEHHRTMKRYIAAKAQIFSHQTRNDYCVLNFDDPITKKLAKKCRAKVIFFSRKRVLTHGAWLENNSIRVNILGRSFAIPAQLRIPGLHNIQNALASAAIGAAAGISSEVIGKTIAEFKGVEHRIEFVRELRGVRYYNDSKGTNVDSTRVALESFNEPVWLILGGRDKGSPYKPLRPLIKNKVSGILLIGEASEKIKRELVGTAPFFDCLTMARSLEVARRHARKGEIVLLSPACASFDQFKDYEDRGKQFKKMVRALT